MGNLGNIADTLLGAAPERPAPHSQLILQQTVGQPIFSEIIQLFEPPGGEAAPLPVHADLNEYDDAWLSGFHFYTDHSDLQMTGAVGSHAEMVSEGLDHVDRHLQALFWL